MRQNVAQAAPPIVEDVQDVEDTEDTEQGLENEDDCIEYHEDMMIVEPGNQHIPYDN